MGEWSWHRPLTSAGFVYGSLLFIAVFFADFLIFAPPPPTYDSSHPALKVLPDDQLATLWFPPPSGDAPVLLWTHGNAEDIGSLAPLLEIFAGQGVGLLAIDYPGYGLSPGKPSESECYRAIDSAFRHLTGEMGIDPGRITLVGQSVGSGPAIWLAAREPRLRGLVLISPFLSIYRVVMPVPLLPGDRFPNLNRMPDLRLPLLLFHGDRDKVIPHSHGEKLHALHPGPEKAFVSLPSTGHNDIWALELDTILTGIMDFALLGKLPVSEP